jgi:PPOX class probable F420-dependent enzyme
VADLLCGKALAHLATVSPAGVPLVTPIWIDRDGDRILVNSSRGRVKNRNMTVGARVALSIVDPEHPYRYLSPQGVLEDCRTAGADERLERLSQRYLGKPYPWRRPCEQRELFVIRPAQVRVRGARHFPGTGR